MLVLACLDDDMSAILAQRAVVAAILAEVAAILNVAATQRNTERLFAATSATFAQRHALILDMSSCMLRFMAVLHPG